MLDDGHGYNSAQGMSLSDAWIGVTINHTEFARNKMGIIPNSLNNDDGPWNQNGYCGTASPFGNNSCFVIEHNNIHDNNNPNVPGIGIAANAPVGTGIEISGGQYDTVLGNRIANEGAWVGSSAGSPTPQPAGQVVDRCVGGAPAGFNCTYEAFGNQVKSNTFHPQRLLREPDERRHRRDDARPQPRELLHRERRHGRHADDRSLRTCSPRRQVVQNRPAATPVRCSARRCATPSSSGRARPRRATTSVRGPGAAARAHDAESVRRRPAQPVVPTQALTRSARRA